MEALIGLLGALIGGLITLRVAQQSFRNQERLLLERRFREERAFLEAVTCEIKAVSSQYMHMVGEKLEQHPKPEPFNWYFPTNGSYFSVFDSNAHAIGFVRDKNLRDLIILTYARAKGLVDSYQYNNELVRQFDEALKEMDFAKAVETAPNLALAKGQLRNYASELRKAHDEAMRTVHEVQIAIEAKLDSPDYWSAEA